MFENLYFDVFITMIPTIILCITLFRIIVNLIKSKRIQDMKVYKIEKVPLIVVGLFFLLLMCLFFYVNEPHYFDIPNLNLKIIYIQRTTIILTILCFILSILLSNIGIFDSKIIDDSGESISWNRIIRINSKKLILGLSSITIQTIDRDRKMIFRAPYRIFIKQSETLEVVSFIESKTNIKCNGKGVINKTIY